MSAPRPAARRRAPKGALTVIAGLMIASGVVRIAGEAGPALAIGSTAMADVADLATPATCGPQDTPAALIEAIAAREARVVSREDRIAERMQALAVAEAEVTDKIAALTGAEASLAALLSQASTAAEDDLNRLTLVYENMKAQDAAALFETMEPAFSAGFMGRMRPESAAAIMTNLPPNVAYSISVVLAGRNANAPVQ